MGTTQRVHSMAIGTDRRRQYITGKYDICPFSEDELDATMDKLIHKAHCRLLERGTGGLLTWSGDTIISISTGRYRLRKTEADPIENDVECDDTNHEEADRDEADHDDAAFMATPAVEQEILANASS